MSFSRGTDFVCGSMAAILLRRMFLKIREQESCLVWPWSACTLEQCLGQEKGPASPARLVASRVFGLRAPRLHCFSSMLLRPVVHQFIAGSESGKYPKHDWVHGKLCLSPNILIIQVNINVCVKWDACPLGQSFDMSKWAKSGHHQQPRPGLGSPRGLSSFRTAALLVFKCFPSFRDSSRRWRL